MTRREDFVRGQMSSVPASVSIPALNHRWAFAAASDFSSDVDVLNFALTLEYLESAFYNQGNATSLLSGDEKTYLERIGYDENFHVKAITAVIKQLGGTPVAAPKVDFGGAFASRMSFLTTSHTFENVGVGAYLGAAGYLKDKTVLQAAAGIFGVEARHAAVVGNLLGLQAEGGVFMGANETPLDKATVLKDVAPFLMNMPSGPPNTGGGSTSGVEDKGLFGAGGAMLLGAGAAAAYAVHRSRSAEDDTPTDVA